MLSITAYAFPTISRWLVAAIFTTMILCAFHSPASTSIADRLESELRPLPSGFSARKHRLSPKPWSYSQNLLYAGRLSVVLPNLRLRSKALRLRCPVNTQFLDETKKFLIRRSESYSARALSFKIILIWRNVLPNRRKIAVGFSVKFGLRSRCWGSQL